MPDMITHTAVAYLVARRWFPRPQTIVFIVGTILPDLLTRGVAIVLPASGYWSVPMHTPLGIVVTSWVAAGFFTREHRRDVFIWLVAGAALHCLLDAPQRNLNIGYFWIFPFWTRLYDGGWYWPEDSLYVMPFLVIAVVALEIGLRVRRRAKSGESAARP